MPTCLSRPESASPATGSAASHKFEQQLLVDQAFGDAAPRLY
jgi:2-oxoglutarate dehydrogenase complex dehydrogenase (E1) component-like enzyme